MCMNTFILLTQIILLLNLDPASSGDISCFNARECVNQASISNDSDSSIQCYGFQSCSNALKLVQRGNSGSDAILCRGSQSCSYANKVVIDSLIGITCSGLLSCAGIGLLQSDSIYHVCYGEQSCINSFFDVNPQTDIIDCNGDHSCANSIFINPKEILATGNMGLYNSSVKMIGNYNKNNYNNYNHSANVSIILAGNFAGYNGNVICSNNSSCHVSCYSNGCNNLTYICDNSSNCTIDCRYSELNDLCNGLDDFLEHGYNYNYNYDYYEYENEFKSILGLDFDTSFSEYLTNSTNVINVCNDSSSTNKTLNCEDYQECQDMLIENTGFPLCCTGYQVTLTICICLVNLIYN